MRRGLALVALLVLAPACGLGEREAYAERVTESTARAIAAGTVRGTVTSTMRLAKAPIDLPPEAAAQRIEMASTFVADLTAHRSLLQDQHLLHDDLVLHLRRADAEENDARPWLTLDLDDLGDDARLPFSNSNPLRLPYTLFAIPPGVLVDLVAGALTGSLESLGTDEIDGVRVTGYGGNFDLDKMLTDTRERDYDEARREAVERTFATLDIKESVHAGEVWVDEEGRPRRIELTFDVSPRRRWTFETTLRLDLLEWGVDATFELPDVQESIKISSISRLMSELGRSFPMPAMQPMPGQLPEGGAPPSEIPAEQPPTDDIEVDESTDAPIPAKQPPPEAEVTP